MTHRPMPACCLASLPRGVAVSGAVEYRCPTCGAVYRAIVVTDAGGPQVMWVPIELADFTGRRFARWARRL